MGKEIDDKKKVGEEGGGELREIAGEGTPHKGVPRNVAEALNASRQFHFIR